MRTIRLRLPAFRAGETWPFRLTKSLHPNAETYVIRRFTETRTTRQGLSRHASGGRRFSRLITDVLLNWEYNVPGDSTLSRPTCFTCVGICSSSPRNSDAIKSVPGKTVRTAKLVQVPTRTCPPSRRVGSEIGYLPWCSIRPVQTDLRVHERKTYLGE